MTEQMNVPKLRFFDEPLTNVGFDSIAKIKIGLTHTPKYVAEGRPFLSSKNISGGYIDFDDIKYMSEEEFQTLPKSAKPKVGDILFTRVGSNLGNPIVLEDDIEFGIFVSLGAITVSERCNNHYVKHWMDTQYFWRQVEQKVAGGAKNNLNSSWLKEFKLKLPLLPEQQKIASFLSKVDEKIALLTEKKDKLTEYKKGVMQQLFNGSFQEQNGLLTFTPPTLRFKADDGSEFPNWENTKLGDVNSITGGGTPSTADESLWGGNIQWFTPTELKTKYVGVSKRTITDKGLSNSSAKILPKGTVLFSSRATVGDVSIAQQECTTNQGFQSFNGKPKKANNEFTYYWISSHKNEFLRRASGSTFLEISKSEIAKVSICLPSFDEQLKIANFLSAIDQKIDLTNSELDKAKEWKKGLLQQMFV
ncbi:restriction endonuclease subunit S [Vibrio harveyi]